MAGYLLLFCCAFALISLRIPYMNWDMIGYVASAKAYESHDAAVLQKEVYELLKYSVPEDRYTALTTGHFREIRATDPESLKQHLPFYQIRVVYTGLIALLWKLGLNPFFASYLISTVCSALAIWILAFMLPGKPHPIHLLVVPVIAISTGFIDLARYSTPDALAVLMVYICYFLLFRRRRLLLLALPASLLIRTDLILLIPIFYLYLWQIRLFDRRIIAFSALMCISLYVAINSYFGNYGWSTTFDYTLSNKSTHPADFPHAVTISSYLTALMSGLRSLALNSAFLTYTVITLVSCVSLLSCLWHTKHTTGRRPQPIDLFFVMFSTLAYILLHFLLFPVDWVRFFAGQYALAMALGMYLLLDAVRSNTGLQPTAKRAGVLSDGG